MKSLRTKASRFFKDSPSHDDNSELHGTDFDAGIHSRSVKKKPSRFFLRKNDKAVKEFLAPPANTSTSALAIDEAPQGQQDDHTPQSDGAQVSGNSSPFPPAPLELENVSEAPSASGSTRSSVKASVYLKPAPSFTTLRSKGSRFFRNNDVASCPPAPPVPQIPVDLVLSQPRPASTLTPLHSTRNSARNSRSSFVSLQSGNVSISRPALLPQYANLPMPKNPVTVPFTKPRGPPSTRPPRPGSLDKDIVAFMQQSGTRVFLPVSNRVSDSTASDSTPCSHASSMEARLGLPSGMGTPRNCSLDSPLAARFPLDALQPLQVRDSTDSVKVSSSSEFIKAEAGGYAGDGVEEDDRELGPIEQHDASKDGHWQLEKRVSQGPNGHPGMLFRDRWGLFHFVADI